MSVVRGEPSCAQQESEPLSCSTFDIWRVSRFSPFWRSARFEDSDWPQIMTLYNLYDAMPTAVVAMNRAIVLAETVGPQVAWRSSTRSHATSRATTSCTPLEPRCGGSDVKRRRYTH